MTWDSKIAPKLQFSSSVMSKFRPIEMFMTVITYSTWNEIG